MDTLPEIFGIIATHLEAWSLVVHVNRLVKTEFFPKVHNFQCREVFLSSQTFWRRDSPYVCTMASIHLVRGQALPSLQQRHIFNAFAALFAVQDRIYISEVNANGTVTSLIICSAASVLPVPIGMACQQVETLVLCCNKLTDASPLCLMGSLRKLVFLGCSRLESLPDRIGEVRTLRTLIIDSCARFEDFSRLANLQRLECLGIFDDVSLDQIPLDVFRLARLQRLHIEIARLQNVPHQIGNLQSLQDLTVVGGQVQVLPQTIWQLANLQRLKILCPLVTHLFIEMDERTRPLVSLTHLDLSANQHLVAISAQLLKLPNLAHLDLSDCWNLTVPRQDILSCTASLVAFEADDFVPRSQDAREKHLFEYMVRMNRAGRRWIGKDNVPPALWGTLLGRVRNDRDALQYFIGRLPDLVQNAHEPENP